MGTRTSGLRLPWLQAVAVLLAVLLALPVVAVMLNLLVPRADTWAHLAGTVLPGYLRNTALLGLGVGLGVVVVGVGCAWLVTLCRFPGRGWLQWALLLPLATPAYVMAYAYTDFLQFAGPLQSSLRELTGWRAGDYWFPEVRSLGGAVFVLAAVLYPYVYLLTRAAFLELSAASLETARVLGLGPWRTFGRIALPLARPAIVAGVSLALMETLADFGTVDYFGVDTFSTGVMRAWFSLGDPVAAAQLGALLLAGVGAVIALERSLRGRAAYFGGAQRAPELYRLTGWRAWGATLACLLPLLAGFLLPLALLLRLALGEPLQEFLGRFAVLALNSVTLAATTALLALPCALLIAYAVRANPGPLSRWCARLSGLGYAVPGVVMAVGVLVPVTLLDRWLSGWIATYTGGTPRLWISGTIAALVFACLARFMSIALQSVEAGLTKIRRSMDDAARSLGLSPARMLVRVHAPLMARSLFAAALLVFVDVMKELPVTLAMRPFNFDTLAVQTYNLAKDERLAEASVAALAIVIVGLLPVFVLSRQMGKR